MEDRKNAVKCVKCESDTILMSGIAYLEADEEPYVSGINEEAEINEVEIRISCLYCPKCDNAQGLYNEGF